MPDFGLLQSPNFTASALAGLQAGQAMGRQKQVQTALSGVDLSNPASITPLLKVDPEHGIALLGASSALLKNERDIAARQATTDYLTARFAPKPSASSGSIATAATPTIAPGAIAQTQTTPADADAAWANLAKYDPDGAVQLRTHLDAMDEKQRAHLVESQSALHDLAAATSVLPYDQRKAYIAAHATDLASHYVTPEQISGFDPTDQNLAVVRQQALGVKGAADAANEAAKLKLAQQKEGREARQGDARIGIARGALKVAQDRAAKAGSGADVSGDDTAALLAAAGL